MVLGVSGLLVLGALVVGLATMLSSRAGPIPADAPGYRTVPMAAGHRSVPLSLHLWYPSDAGTIELIGQNALFYGFHGRRDAAPSGGPYPLLMLSHGSGGNAERLGWIAAELAARGMIVAAVNHPGTTSNDSLPAQTVMPWERVADLKAVLDLMEKDPPAGLRPEMTRIGALGYSLGGATALLIGGARLSKQAFIDYCRDNAGRDDCGWLTLGGVDFGAIEAVLYEQDNRDARVGVVVAVDPALSRAMTLESLERLPATLLINLGAPSELSAAMRADALAEAIPTAKYVSVPGSAHFSFLARCSALGVVVIALAGDDNICSDRGLRARDEVQAEIVEIVSAFLRGQP